MAQATPGTLLRRLEQVRLNYGDHAAADKLELIRALARRRMKTSEQLLRFHDVLCFLRAYPDDTAVLGQVEKLLERFDRRADLQDHRETLADSGVAGTSIWYPFYWVTAQWLAERWPDRIEIDWDAFEGGDGLVKLLSLLLPYSESVAVDMVEHTPREWIERLKGPRETDATFLIRRFATLRTDGFGLENAYEALDVPILLQPGKDTPSRTRATTPERQVHFQTKPLSRARPAIEAALAVPPDDVRKCTLAEAKRMIDVVRSAMVVRHRDLDAFAYANPRDVRVVDCGGGLEFVCFGQLPERRLLLESVYGFMTVKNGVPIGYVLASSLFRSTEIAFNVFETWRGAEAGHVFGRVLSMARHLFGTEVFAIDPYQLGHGNQEGLQSGAWWFYYKLGFRPKSPYVKRLLRSELRKMRADPTYRTDIETLNELASDYMFWSSVGDRDDVLGLVPLDTIGSRISDHLARRHGADREAGIAASARENESRLGVKVAGWTADERMAWSRWAPLVEILPGVNRWPAKDRKALAAVIRAKGSHQESDFVQRFNEHPRLHKALARLAV